MSENSKQPERKSRIDGFGAAMLIGISAFLGLNQVLIKLVNAGMAPAFQAGMRSVAAILPVLLFALWRKKRLSMTDGSLLPGIVCGLFFAFEFALLFKALDYTSIGRASVLFYTMPVWVALIAHFIIPGEPLTPWRITGLLLAVAGVAIALMRNDHPASENAFLGDMMALLAATGWAGIALTARTTRLSRSVPEMQLLYQLVVSAPILLLMAFATGDTFRQMTPMLWGLFSFQVLGIAFATFLLWFWVLSIYPASDMASYAFLTPLFGVLFGWLVFGEQLTANIVLALALVGAGIYLVNRRRRSSG
jgi:drug/metabolite transporter (DMT)-like permease